MIIGTPKHPPKPRPVIEGVTPIRQTGDPTPEGAGCGRPSSYLPEYCQALIDYFARAEPWRVHYNNSGSAQVIPVDKTPTFKRFAVNLGVTQDTLYKWAGKYPDFKHAMDVARDAVYDFRSAQGSVGIGSTFNRAMLACEHGLIEPKAEAEEKGDAPIQKVIVEVVGANQHKGD